MSPNVPSRRGVYHIIVWDIAGINICSAQGNRRSSLRAADRRSVPQPPTVVASAHLNTRHQPVARSRTPANPFARAPATRNMVIHIMGRHAFSSPTGSRAQLNSIGHEGGTRGILVASGIFPLTPLANSHYSMPAVRPERVHVWNGNRNRTGVAVTAFIHVRGVHDDRRNRWQSAHGACGRGPFGGRVGRLHPPWAGPCWPRSSRWSSG